MNPSSRPRDAAGGAARSPRHISSVACTRIPAPRTRSLTQTARLRFPAVNRERSPFARKAGLHVPRRLPNLVEGTSLAKSEEPTPSSARLQCSPGEWRSRRHLMNALGRLPHQQAPGGSAATPFQIPVRPRNRKDSSRCVQPGKQPLCTAHASTFAAASRGNYPPTWRPPRPLAAVPEQWRRV
jgi:hypothetical protein